MSHSIYNPEIFCKIKQKAFSSLNIEKEHSIIGACIDASCHFKDNNTLDKLEKLCKSIIESAASNKIKAYLHFYVSNIYAERNKSAANGKWNDKELINGIFHLQSAYKSLGFKSIKNVDKCAILTNIASRHLSVGRFIETLDYVKIALGINSKFGMAYLIQSNALESYARNHYLHFEQYHLLSHSEKAFKSALIKKLSHSGENYRASAEKMLKRISDWLDNVDSGNRVNIDNAERQSLGRSSREREYRQWCLKQNLFLTALNDISEFPAAADDIITQPTVKSSIPKPPNILFHYTQLKQEYITARWMLFESLSYFGLHYSDRRVELYDLLDDACYSYATEHLKIAFKSFYGIFDKIAFLLNDYLSIGMNPRNITFRTIWYEKGGKVKQIFIDGDNYCFHGLFWLSMELFDKENRQTISPDSKYINELRNRLEHRIIRIVNPCGRLREGSDFYYNVCAKDSPDYDSIYLDDFVVITLRLAKLVRAALIYLSLGIHAQEHSEDTREDGGYVVIPGVSYSNIKKTKI